MQYLVHVHFYSNMKAGVGGVVGAYIVSDFRNLEFQFRVILSPYLLETDS